MVYVGSILAMALMWLHFLLVALKSLGLFNGFPL
jgi:hypothetical protein